MRTVASTLLVLILLLSPTLALGQFRFFSQTIEFGDLVERDGLYYEKFANVPFTGKVTGLVKGFLDDGVWDGPWVQYHENGQLMWEGR